MSDSVTDFFAAWAMPDSAARTERIAGALGDEIYYVDPRTPAALTSVAAVTGYVAEFGEMAPGWPVAAVDIATTQNFVRATVRFGEDEQAQWGQYIADLDDAGRIVRLVGFKGPGGMA